MSIPGPLAKKIVNQTKKYCVKSTFAYPLVIKKGEGCYLEDIDGNRYLDFNSLVSTCNIGYGHPEIMKVLKEYSKISPYKIAGQDFYCSEEANLAKKLVEITPRRLRKVFLSNSGAEAVENAIKFVYFVKGPLYGVSCTRAFHGRTIGALSLTHSKAVQSENIPQINNKIIKFCTEDDPDIYQLETLIRREGRPAYVIIECVQGEGGYRPASKEFIKTLRKITLRFDIPLIVDEIQAGMGRTGCWWSFEHYGIKPDIMTVAKSLQVGATLTIDEYAPKKRGMVSSTWGGGHRLDLAIALKRIEIIEKEKLIRNARKMGKYLLKRLKELEERYPKLIDVRGLGLMIGIEFENERIRDEVEQKAFKRGLLLLGCGFKSIRIAPPLIIKEQEIDKGLEILEGVLKCI